MNTVALSSVAPESLQDKRVGAESSSDDQDALFTETLSTTMRSSVVDSGSKSLKILDAPSANGVSDHSVVWRMEGVVQLPQQLDDVPEIALVNENSGQISPSELTVSLFEEGVSFVPQHGKNLPNVGFSLANESDLIELQSRLPALSLRTGGLDSSQGNIASVFNVEFKGSSSSALNPELNGIRLDDVLSIGDTLKQSAGDVPDFSNGIFRRDANHNQNVPLSEIMAFLEPKEFKRATDATKMPQDVFASLLSKFSADEGRNHDVAQIGKGLDGVVNDALFQELSLHTTKTTIGRSQSAPDSSVQTALNLYQRDWPKQLAEILVQQGRYGHHKATVRLDPPELGPLHVTIRQHGNDTFVHVTARHPDTLQILQVTADRLREIMQTSQSGFVQVDVSGHDQSQAEARSRSYVSPDRTAEKTTDELTGLEDKHADNSRVVTGLRLTHLIDYFA